tara:strand:+ start:3707 stop:6112 length:2406 start_codon:yes stop_codon:yes gene_type:complete
MTLYKKILSIFIFLSFTLIVWLFSWFDHPIPIYEGEINLKGLDKPVDVYFDKWAVPHVFAKNENDLFFAAGYLAARERLFQLSTVAFAVRGELASALGDQYLSTDIYLRTWRIHHTAQKMVSKMDHKKREIYNSFCNGINYHIKETKKDLPIEFKILGIKPPLWDPSVVAGYERMMAHEMQGSWEPEIVYGAIASYFGEKKLSEIIPGYHKDKPTIVELDFKEFKPVFDLIIKEEFSLRNIFGKQNADIGSNNWVVSGSKTKSNRPLLANDPHLAFSQPSRWFEMHLKGGRFNVSGVCLAGIPVPVIGQNEDVAWGFTNTMVDDVDFFVETLNPKNKNEYKYDEEWRPITIIEEKVPLKSGKDTTITIRLTHHGPIISDIHGLLKNSKNAISMSWTGHWITSEMDAWIDVNLMKDWDDFSEALKNFGVPGQNIVYADKKGNIGWRPAVFIPIRKEGFSMIPRPGTKSEYDWKGRVPYDEMPFLYNPPDGFISTANNKIIGDEFPYYISGLWADPSRAEQIKYRLDTLKNATVEDMKQIQLDLKSRFALEVRPHIIAAQKGSEKGNLKKAFSYLENWDGIEDVDSQAALIFHVFMRCLTKNIYGDELELLGEDYLIAYSGLKYLVHRNIREILNGKKSSWVDNIQTKNKIESIREIIYYSMINAVKEIENRYGINNTNWKWGDAHSVIHPHLLSEVSILDRVFNLSVGPYRSGGSDKTPNAGGYSFQDPYNQTSGASMRRIVDFSDLNETQLILPTGQSGIPSSPHYKDQADMYHKGLYRTTRFSEDYIRSSDGFKKLVLIP